jgi:hypothetical protein
MLLLCVSTQCASSHTWWRGSYMLEVRTCGNACMQHLKCSLHDAIASHQILNMYVCMYVRTPAHALIYSASEHVDVRDTDVHIDALCLRRVDDVPMRMLCACAMSWIPKILFESNASKYLCIEVIARAHACASHMPVHADMKRLCPLNEHVHYRLILLIGQLHKQLH